MVASLLSRRRRWSGVLLDGGDDPLLVPRRERLQQHPVLVEMEQRHHLRTCSTDQLTNHLRNDQIDPPQQELTRSIDRSIVPVRYDYLIGYLDAKPVCHL